MFNPENLIAISLITNFIIDQDLRDEKPDEIIRFDKLVPIFSKPLKSIKSVAESTKEFDKWNTRMYYLLKIKYFFESLSSSHELFLVYNTCTFFVCLLNRYSKHCTVYSGLKNE